MSTLHYILALPDHLPEWPTEAYGAPPTTTKSDALYSTLWSDIGDDFYRRCGIGSRDGWKTVLNETLAWDIKKRDAPIIDTSGVRFLTDWNADPLLPFALVQAYEHKRLRQAGGGHASETKGTSYILDSANSPGLVNYYLVRGIQNRSLTMETPGTETYGFFIPNSMWAVWFAVFDEVESKYALKITSIGVLSLDEEQSKLESDIARLKSIVLHQAKVIGCDEITIWALPERIQTLWLASETSIRVVKRKDHLGAIAWYGSEHAHDVQWEGGEE